MVKIKQFSLVDEFNHTDKELSASLLDIDSSQLSSLLPEEKKVVEVANIARSNWVTKHNDLIESEYNATLQQQRILLIIASKVEPTDDAFKMYEFRTKDVIEAFGLKKSSGYYSQIKEIVKGLHDVRLTVKTQQQVKNFSWVTTTSYNEKEPGVFYVELNHNLRPFLLQLKEKFTKYRLEYVLSLNSTYSIRIYELLKQYQPLGNRKFTLDELKKILAIDPEKYKQYSHFKNKIVLYTQKELEQHTDIRFDFKEIKTGRKVTKLEFFIYSNVNKQSATSKVHNISEKPKGKIVSENVSKLDQELLELGLTNRKITSIKQEYSEKDILANIGYTKERVFLGRVKRPAAYLTRALQENFAASKISFGKLTNQNGKTESKEKAESLKGKKEERMTIEDTERYIEQLIRHCLGNVKKGRYDLTTADEKIVSTIKNHLKEFKLLNGYHPQSNDFNSPKVREYLDKLDE